MINRQPPYLLLLLTAFTALVFSSCAKNYSEPPSLQLDGIYSEQNAIRSYLRAKGQDSGLVVHPAGLCYKIIEPGNNRDYITSENVPVVIFERRRFQDEKLLESSLGLPTSFDGRKLKDHIFGWQVGLPQISKGGRIIMYIPSSLAFGNTGVPNVIPGNTILICDVTLVDFK